MAFFFTESQVVEAARRAFRDHAESDRKSLAEWQAQGPVRLSDWTDPDTELDQLGEAIKDALAMMRPDHPIVGTVDVGG